MATLVVKCSAIILTDPYDKAVEKELRHLDWTDALEGGIMVNLDWNGDVPAAIADEFKSYAKNLVVHLELDEKKV